MKKEKMWKELAKYYDLIYEWKPYQQEAQKIHSLIQRHKKTSGNELLEVGCGTGNHIPHLKTHYSITGTDLNSDMLKVAKKKFPSVTFKKADMISFNLKKKFDVITCLFAAIGYVKTYQNFTKTIQRFAKHLKPGGVLIIEPFISSDAFNPKHIGANFVNKKDVKLARMNINKKRGMLAILNFHFLIATKKGVGYLQDTHELALFNLQKATRIMNKNGVKRKPTPLVDTPVACCALRAWSVFSDPAYSN